MIRIETKTASSTQEVYASPGGGAAKPAGKGVRLSGLVTGNRLLTPRGYRTVESLRRGDQVAALIGRGPLFVPITWIGRRSLNMRRGSLDHVESLVRIRSGAIAHNMPARDLLIAPEHAIYIQGSLFLARHLVNRASILFESNIRPLDYWGVQLERHDILVAENLAVESLLPSSAAAFAEVKAPALRLVGNDVEAGAAFESAALEFSAATRMSVRWFRRRLLNRRPSVETAQLLPRETPALPDGLLDVDAEARAVAGDFANLASQRGMRIQLAVEEGLTVRIARERLHELLGAMLTHAIHGMFAGHILIGAMRHAGRIQLAVIDGAGDVDAVTQQAELQFAMQLAALQGATLEVDVRRGEGTTLLLRLLAP